MKNSCPYCNTPLTSGYAEIHGTALGFLIAGYSYENLYFRRENEEEIKILESGGSTAALRCESCGVVILNTVNSFLEVTISDSEFTKLTRESIISLLELWSSKEQQLDYKNAYPELNVAEELIMQWIDSYTPDLPDFTGSFRPKELKALALFDVEVKRYFTEHESAIPDYGIFVATNAWSKMNAIAVEVLKELQA